MTTWSSRICVIALLIVGPGCASMFLHGGRLAGKGTSTPGALAQWTVPACTTTDGGSVAPPADTRYLLLRGEGGDELFERSGDGSGAIITNRWSDAAGTHFYAWVKSSGWEYIVSQPGQPAVRRVYTSGTENNRPRGAPSAECAMLPAG
jgi:hypothetical protein